MEKNISIIIVTYNSESLIDDCLESIFKFNDINDGIEVIIVDNMSKNVDLMFSSIRRKFGDEIVLIKNDKNGGYGQGNNVGINASTAPITMIMNPDVRLLNSVFKKARVHFSDSKVAMLGMLQMVSNTKKGISYSIKLNYFAIINIFETILSNKFNYYNSSKMYVSGSCFFIRKSVFQEIGLFDENVFMYGEENDLHHRLRILKSSYKIIFDKKLTYLHLSENRPLAIKTWLQMLHSNLYFCRKYGISEERIIKNEILTAKFFRALALLKFKKDSVKTYNEWLDLLAEEKESLGV
jgi:GT2 family glycosyltransferase